MEPGNFSFRLLVVLFLLFGKCYRLLYLDFSYTTSTLLFLFLFFVEILEKEEQ